MVDIFETANKNAFVNVFFLLGGGGGGGGGV
jgi:hypothetical protein